MTYVFSWCHFSFRHGNCFQTNVYVSPNHWLTPFSSSSSKLLKCLEIGSSFSSYSSSTSYYPKLEGSCCWSAEEGSATANTKHRVRFNAVHSFHGWVHITKEVSQSIFQHRNTFSAQNPGPKGEQKYLNVFPFSFKDLLYIKKQNTRIQENLENMKKNNWLNIIGKNRFTGDKSLLGPQGSFKPMLVLTAKKADIWST